MQAATAPATETSAKDQSSLPVGVHLVGSIPLSSATDVFTRTSEVLGNRLKRIPDGETGPRSDWILWQYPVFSSRPQFQVGPPSESSYRTLPQLMLRPGEDGEGLKFDDLGYFHTATTSYREFAGLKRDGVIPPGARFQLSLPTPIAPVSSFVAPADQAQLEPIYEARVLEELDQIVNAIPADQLAIQWDTRVEFAMMEGVVPTWFPDVKAGILERLLRLSRHVPADVELGYHLCYGDEAHGHFADPEDTRKLVDITNAVATSLDRPLNWVHMPVPHERTDDEYFAPLEDLRLSDDTELYLGVVHLSDGVEGTTKRIAAASRHVESFGVATDCGWGRGGTEVVDELLELHREVSAPWPASRKAAAGFDWPKGFDPIPTDKWTSDDVHKAGLAYDAVDEHGWYSNLDPLVEQLAANLSDGDILLDYSGGTGILLDRLGLRIFDRQVGIVIVDSSAKFLRVALEKYKEDPRVGLRLLRYLKDEKRLQTLDDVLGPELLERGVDAIASCNAIHLYPDLGEVASIWARTLRPGGKVFINSGNLRNPRANDSEWILDETVWVINDIAEGLVRSDPQYAKYRPALDDVERVAKHNAHRDRVFLKPRPLDHYLDELSGTGLTVTDVSEETIEADVQEWFELMVAYHDAVLGWIGGTEKIDGAPPSEEAVEDRLKLIRQAMDTIFGDRSHFYACWTYITATKEA
jgi:SAM-dependent methyltransferase